GQALDALDRLVEHLLGEIDPGEVARPGIERQGQPGGDADLEHRIAALESQPVDCCRAARGEEPVESGNRNGGQKTQNHLEPAAFLTLRPLRALRRCRFLGVRVEAESRAYSNHGRGPLPSYFSPDTPLEEKPDEESRQPKKGKESEYIRERRDDHAGRDRGV